MAAPADGRSSGPPLPGDQAGGSAYTHDLKAGVEAWLAGHAGAPAPDDPVADGPDANPEDVARKILLDQLTGNDDPAPGIP